ncbi:hypothetical protein Vadar_013766 [Vaccinium darrowii]|uniref:Uncharacterized protein n=1 Tax=Vaccinium darrowii TaxID=229202 RepID=A0ACB7X0M2_9ERIC|nr:hypothetical protein Vadar_013766 [Vaccinium darrowii]
MVLKRAWTWIPRLWDKLICIHKLRFDMRDLPQEILIDILSRLPGDCVLECQRVCKEWLALISTPSFVEMHLKRATSVFLVQVCRDLSHEKFDMFIFDEGAKANKKFKKMDAKLMNFEESLMPRLCGSCDGLLVFCQTFPNVSFVYNPLTRENISIRNPVPSSADCAVCGFFFHPILKDYRLLFMHKEGIRFRYFICSLGSQLWRKLDDFSYQPRSLPCPILNGALHWMAKHNERGQIPPCSNSIMIFNMDTEEFRHMPHPGPECSAPWKHNDASIFERKGKLAFCSVSNKQFVYVWLLEDYENWIWVEGYLVNLHLDFEPHITLANIQDDELLFKWGSRGVFKYNMCQNTVKQIREVGLKKLLRWYAFDFISIIIPYTMTFVSPSGFK